ncbi:MAG: DUF2079 domain-containing protein [Candidatus Methylomirabilia bacterium]
MPTERAGGFALPFSAAALLFAGAVSTLMLAACWSDLTSLRYYPIDDFGIYTNFIWNSAHGAPFKYLVDQNYLSTHLSFTLLLLAPLFRLWDHVFVLIAVQWSLPLLGGAIVFATAARLGLGLPLRAALASLFVAYPYAQSPVLYTFHGVCLYFLLVPWLYHCLRFSRKWLWLPWLLTLGLREDAGLLVMPLLLYFGFAHRDRGARLLALLTALYSALAIFVIFPTIAGESLAARRAIDIGRGRLLNSLDPPGLLRRVVAVFWLMLPALPLLQRRWRPLWIFPSAGMAILLLNWWSVLHTFAGHYSAYVFPLFVVGLLEAVAGDERYRGSAGEAASFRLAGWVMGALVVAHFTAGRFPVESPRSARRLNLARDPATRSALEAARAVPRTGLLAVDNRLFALVANRADIVALKGKRFGRPPDGADIVFLMRTEKGGEELFRRLSADGAFSVRFADERFAVFVRVAPRPAAARQKGT